MECITRDVRDIDALDRQALEHAFGMKLRDNQRLIVQLAEIEHRGTQPSADVRPAQTLEDWTQVFDGLTDDEIDEIDRIAKTRAMTQT